MNFWLGLLCVAVGAYNLYRNWQGQIRLTFRAGLYMWLLIFAGLAIALGMIG